MNLSALLAPLREQSTYQRLLDQLLEKTSPDEALEIPKAVRPMLVSALYEDLQQPILYIVPQLNRLLTLHEEIPNWAPNVKLHRFPNPNPLFYELSPWSESVRNERTSALAFLTQGEGPGSPQEELPGQSLMLLASSRAMMTRTLPKRTFLANSRYVKQGAAFRFDQLLSLLMNNSYAQSSIVTERGQFSRRGGILDLWPPAEEFPIRLEFFGDDVESLRCFDPTSQRTIKETTWVWVTPAREGLLRDFDKKWSKQLPGIGNEDDLFLTDSLELFLPLMNSQPSGISNFLPKNTVVVFDDKIAFTNAVADIEQQALSMHEEAIAERRVSSDFPLPYLTLPDLEESLVNFTTLDLGMNAGIVDMHAVPLANSFTPGPRFGGQLESILKHLSDKRTDHETVVIVSRQAQRLCELWSEYDNAAEVRQEILGDLPHGEIIFIQGPLSGGWIQDLAQGDRLHLLSDAELFGWSRPRPRRRSLARPSAPEESFADLQHGNYVVHIDYGIGRFIGLVERRLDEIQREFLLIEYADGDQLYIPVHQADRISRYVGADSSSPSLSRLGSSEWTRSKGKAREAVEQIARDLLELYAERQTVLGTAFPPDTAWQKELEASFAHQETEDQIRALEAIKGDMERPKPMDRLICGDVGYGKTEVALRAAFKAVMHGKQAAMLVPTTVLAQQHFNTFRRRLAAFPIKVEMLSRFRSRSEMAEIITRLVSGEIDMVIGTHRLLQPDVLFKDLGLLIIDEEQRFGVTHKEFLKRMRTEVDVLTLTATPIPRTLYMALTGVRDISTISTPPEDRLPVRTHVGLYDPQLVRSAILRELDRGGQVFFVHNRVQTIATMQRRLERLVPEARFTMAHGQMPEKRLSQTMEQFARGEIDVLVSTSIIESGLDIPNANTLIVDRADRFGLAQLYQLRGRVGRAAIQGFSYFFRSAGQRATEEALQRLEIIAEHSQLGAGYAIAMRDLEMRGAGDILGTRQHGYIASVGFHLYTRLLSSAVRRMRLEMGHELVLPEEVRKTTELPPAAIDIPLPAVIPDDYIADRTLRLQLYRRLAELRSLDELETIDAELHDRFGPTPKEILNLLYQLKVKIIATNAGIDRIMTESGQILIDLPEKKIVPDIHAFGEGIRRSKRGLWLSMDIEGGWEKKLLQLLNHILENA